MDSRRIYRVEKPVFTKEDFELVSRTHSGKYLELFYNLVLANDSLSLPDHLRPVTVALGDPSIEKLMIIISPGAGKSQEIDVVFPAWELGLDPTTSVLAVSAAEGLMVDFLQAAMNIIEHNPLYRAIFPNVIPDKDTGWSTSRGIYVQRGQYGTSGIADPSYCVSGYKSKRIIGKHARIICVDDIHDDENSSSMVMINSVENWYYKNLVGRRSPQGTRFVMIGRRWDENDLYGRLRRAGDWLVMELSALQESDEDPLNLFYEAYIPAGLSCIFNNYKPQTSLERIKIVYGVEDKKTPKFFWPGQLEKYKESKEVERNKPDVFQTVYQSKPEQSSTKIFKEEDFRYFKPPANLSEGRNYADVAEFVARMFEYIVQSWDTSLTGNSSSDPNCGYTLGLKPCREDHRSSNPETETPFHYDIYVLDEYFAILDYGALHDAVTEYYHKWQPNQPLIIENSALGSSLLSILPSENIPVQGINTQNTTKRSRAINGAKAGSAQGWFRQGRILLPDVTESAFTDNLKTELKDFTGAKKGEDNRVDALIHGVNFAIDLGINARDLPTGWRNEDEVQARMAEWSTNEHPFFQLAEFAKWNPNPFEGLCGTCRYFKNEYCNLHKRNMSSMHSCNMYIKAGSTLIVLSERN